MADFTDRFLRKITVKIVQAFGDTPYAGRTLDKDDFSLFFYTHGFKTLALRAGHNSKKRVLLDADAG